MAKKQVNKVQPVDQIVKRPLCGVGADMNLVDHVLRQWQTGPVAVGPVEGAVHHFRRPVHAERLVARRRVGPVLAADAIEVATARRDILHEANMIAVLLRSQRHRSSVPSGYHRTTRVATVVMV